MGVLVLDGQKRRRKLDDHKIVKRNCRSNSGSHTFVFGLWGILAELLIRFVNMFDKLYYSSGIHTDCSLGHAFEL